MGISKICGVAKANIAKINNIANANIKKVNTVTFSVTPVISSGGLYGWGANGYGGVNGQGDCAEPYSD
jgi:hypothetical protein